VRHRHVRRSRLYCVALAYGRIRGSPLLSARCSQRLRPAGCREREWGTWREERLSRETARNGERDWSESHSSRWNLWRQPGASRMTSSGRLLVKRRRKRGSGGRVGERGEGNSLLSHVYLVFTGRLSGASRVAMSSTSWHPSPVVAFAPTFHSLSLSFPPSVCLSFRDIHSVAVVAD